MNWRPSLLLYSRTGTRTQSSGGSWLHQLLQSVKSGERHGFANIWRNRIPQSCRLNVVALDFPRLHCPCKVLDGRVTHSHEPQCLTPSLKAQGYVALCCASVVGDATILTHQGAKLRAARALQLDRMRHNLG
ncbi:hypothetical protein PLESTB_000899700 [Pleodorina starrii]|uniref:Uncharacterized protein n=1 Tax=Pleodorina starrii TaxID=330485 RepID=A0A9W6BNT8_9CHLO|nr:hypothetical protein PLESTB_000899700 [Pleodorina starrii]